MTIITGENLTPSDRQFQQSEWDAVDKALLGPNYEHFNWNKHRFVFRAIDSNKKLAGLLVLEVHAGVAKVEELIVQESNRRQGIATRLVQYAENHAYKEGAHKITLETNETKAAVALYEKLGYGLENKLRHHYARLDWVVMSKDLS